MRLIAKRPEPEAATPPPLRITPLSPNTAASPLSSQFGALIIELVAQLEPLAVILKRYGISKSSFAALRATEAFQSALKEQQRTFSSLANTPDRVRMKAQVMTEALLDDMFTVAAHPLSPPSARVSAFSQIKNLTGLEKPEAPVPQQKFSLTINLSGNKTVHVESSSAGQGPIIDAKPVPANPYNADEGTLDEEDFDDYEPEQSSLPSPPDRPWSE